MKTKQAIAIAIEYLERERKRLSLSAQHYEQDPEFWSKNKGAWQRWKEIGEAIEALGRVHKQSRLF